MQLPNWFWCNHSHLYLEMLEGPSITRKEWVCLFCPPCLRLFDTLSLENGHTMAINLVGGSRVWDISWVVDGATLLSASSGNLASAMAFKLPQDMIEKGIKILDLWVNGILQVEKTVSYPPSPHFSLPKISPHRFISAHFLISSTN